jgi:hypothetical protein
MATARNKTMNTPKMMRNHFATLFIFYVDYLSGVPTPQIYKPSGIVGLWPPVCFLRLE